MFFFSNFAVDPEAKCCAAQFGANSSRSSGGEEATRIFWLTFILNVGVFTRNEKQQLAPFYGHRCCAKENDLLT